MSRGEAMTSTPRPELRGIALRLSTDHDGAEPAPLLRSSAGSACAAPVCGPRAPAEKYGTPSAQRWVHVRIAALHEGELRKAHMGRSSRQQAFFRSRSTALGGIAPTSEDFRRGRYATPSAQHPLLPPKSARATGDPWAERIGCHSCQGSDCGRSLLLRHEHVRALRAPCSAGSALRHLLLDGLRALVAREAQRRPVAQHNVGPQRLLAPTAHEGVAREDRRRLDAGERL